MKRRFTAGMAIAAFVLCAATLAEETEKKLQMKDLPPAVQKTVQAELNGGEIKGISKEKEDGVTQYEIETMVNGKHRDFDVDTKGLLLEVEEETSIDTIPPVVQAAILKKVGAGKLGMVELVKRKAETLYEAAYTSKDGKKREALFKADGTETKD